MGTAVKDAGDPLLNVWIISWNVEQVVMGNLTGFFDANIFYPHPKTLAYSEFLIPQSIVAAPVLLASGNPILAYNVTLILAIATTAFATFLLGRLLTNNPLAGFVAGLAFAFNPYLFDHLSHLQVLTAAGIPLAFFFLHKYFESGSVRHLLLFSLSFAMQALANGYYAVFLTYFAGLFILDRAVRLRWLFKPWFWGHMALHAVVTIGLLAPFYYQYVWLRVNVGFVRNNVYRGTMWSFMSTSQWNNLYGELTSELSGAEWHLFPGLTVLGLGVLGVLAAMQRQGPAESLGSDDSASPAARVAGPIYRVAGWTIVACLFLVAVISATGGIVGTLWSIPIRATGIMRPLWIGAAALFVRVGLVGTLGDRVRAGSLTLREPQRLYVWMLVLALLMTLGSEGLYRLAYDHAPGFDAIRGAGRIHVVSVFCLAVLSAFGAQKLLSRLGARGKMMAVVFLPALLCLEQLSVPTPTVTVPLKEQIPPVYRWLAEQDGQFSIVEYPLDRRAERLRVYYAIYHSKLLVNGRSGYYSPVYLEFERRSEDLPWEDIVRDHEALGVRYLLVHREGFGERGRTAAQQLMRLQEDVLQSRLQLVEDLGGTIVYELTAREPRDRESFRE